MKSKLAIFVAALAVGLLYVASAQDSSTAEAERYIRESEHQWADSVATGDASKVRLFLADDFLGVEPDGSFYDKAGAIRDTTEGPKDFVSNHLNNDVKVRFFGETAVAQGSESWVRHTGTPLSGRYVWTDTWIKRNGRWQVVASEDLIVADSAK